MTALSERGEAAAGTPLRIDYEAHREAASDPFHPVRNPDGAIALNVAENALGWPELRSRIEAVARAESIPDWVPRYASPRGALPFRVAAADFLSTHLAGSPVDPNLLCASAGATAVIELSGLMLADAGDVAVIPAPAYPVYRRDLGMRARVERYDLVTHHEPDEIRGGPLVDIHHLERARKEIEGRSRRFRMLILTTPDNPTGGMLPAERLARIADWCIEERVHLVVNEIYGLSLIDTDHPDLAGDYGEVEPFVSFGRIMDERSSDYLHLWYALSKDLGISGFRVGLVWSLNERFVRAYENVSLTHSVSNHTQWLLSRVLADRDFTNAYIDRHRARLTEAYATLVRALRKMRIPYVPARGSLFCWADFSELLDEDSEAGELALWRSLFDETRVLLTPGVGFGHTKHGLFRIVYPAVPPDELAVAIERLEAFVERRRTD